MSKKNKKAVEEEKIEVASVEAEEVQEDEIDIYSDSEVQEANPVVAQAPADVVGVKEKKLVGHHPISKEPVYV
ncbi:MAG: hypothetical protein H0X02_00760 [Nitrosomonas sp.]|nr:hypothetical protein [Nitrosomonas sp.]